MTRSGSRGFTLVEMVIALVVLSFISLGTVTALRTLGNTQQRLSETTARVDELRQVSQFLRASLRQAMAPLQAGFDGMWVASASGLPRAWPEEVIWLAPFDAAGGAGGLVYFRLYRDNAHLRLQFQRYHQAFNHDSWAALEAGNILVDGLQSFEVSYRIVPFGPWLESLAGLEDQLTGLPDIRIVIRADGRYWPDILVSPDLPGGR